MNIAKLYLSNLVRLVSNFIINFEEFDDINDFVATAINVTENVLIKAAANPAATKPAPALNGIDLK